MCKSVPCGSHRVPYKNANWSLRQLLGMGLGPFPILSMERLSASERACGLSIINSRCSVKTGLEHQMPRDDCLTPSLYSARVWVLSLKVTQLCLTLCDPTDCTVHGILQARILEWVAIPFSRGSSQPRDRTQVSCIAGGFFTN